MYMEKRSTEKGMGELWGGGETEVSREGMGELQARITHFSVEEKPAGWKEKHPQPLPLLFYHFCSILLKFHSELNYFHSYLSEL